MRVCQFRHSGNDEGELNTRVPRAQAAEGGAGPGRPRAAAARAYGFAAAETHRLAPPKQAEELPTATTL